MRMARAATMALAALLLVQVAFALDKKIKIEVVKVKKSPAPTPPYKAPVVVVEPKLKKVKTQVEYCFHAKTKKPSTPTICPLGYTLDKLSLKCTKTTAYSCKIGTLSKDAKGNAVCVFCKPWQKEVDGKCVKECGKGYTAVIISGKSQCVEGCPKGYTSQGNECISEKKEYTPKQCTSKLCLPGFKLYFTEAAMPVAAKVVIPVAVNATKAMGRKLSNAPVYKKVPDCICRLTSSRKVYEQEVEKPQALKALKQVEKAEPYCENGAKAFLGSCPLSCPSATKEVKGQCVFGCPSGYTECKTWYLKKFCVKTNAYAPSADVCKEAKKVIVLDKADECPTPMVKPSSSPAVVVKASAFAKSG